jgi:hypothetical protein
VRAEAVRAETVRAETVRAEVVPSEVTRRGADDVARLAELARSLQPPPSPAPESTVVTVGITNPDGGTHAQEWADGVLRAWYEVPSAYPVDVRIERPLALERALVLGTVDSPVWWAEATAVRVGTRTVTYPPLLPQWAGDVLADGFEHASASVQFELDDHPFGTLPIAYEFGPSSLERCGYYRLEQPDVTFRCRTLDVVRYTTGRYSMLEFVSRGRVDGDLFALTVVTTLFDNQRLRRAAIALVPALSAYEAYLRCVVCNDWRTWGGLVQRYAAGGAGAG